MNFTHKYLLLATTLFALLLSACGPADTGASSEVLTQAAIIYSESLTQTAAAVSPTVEASATEKPDKPTKTPKVEQTVTVTGTPPTATLSPTPGATSAATAAVTQSANTPCLRASFEIETIPDGTQITVDKLFTKSWRLKNTGTCNWEAGFAAIWVQGELFDAESVTLFTKVTIFPGEYAWIEIDMVAPSPPGHYKGYWMLRSDQGNVFGVGARGTEWFWVDIESIPIQD